VIDLADFPEADPDDVGKYRNIIYGSLKKVVCPWTIGGWLSTLTADITAGQTSIVVSDSNAAPATPFTAIIDKEQVRVTVNTKATGTLTISRGYGGTTAVIHSGGASIYHQRTDFEAEVAQHPVKSIGDIYVERDKDWVRVISGATKYINTGGRAYIKFSDKVKFEEKVGLTADPHTHTITLPGLLTKKCIPSTNNNATDNSFYTYESGITTVINFASEDNSTGTVVRQYIYVALEGGAGWQVTCNGQTAFLTGDGWHAPVPPAFQRCSVNGGLFTDSVSIYKAGGSNVYECYKEVEYIPAAPTAANTTSTFTGNSLANMLIGNRVACDVEGYQDDGSGTYTGTPNALIERPDHIRKHILIALLSFVAGDLDLAGSWTTTGTEYNSRAYKFAFVMHEVATETMDLFEKMDQQSRSTMFESAGVFKLTFMVITTPTSQKTFDSDNIKGFFTFSKTEVADLRNKFRGHYLRDYTKTGDLGTEYQKVLELSNSASITKYGIMDEDLEFSCIGDLVAMVDDVMDWILLESKELKKKVSFTAFWDATILESCDYFTVTSNFWTGLEFKTLKMVDHMADQTIEIEGLQFTAT
jgi:hypothetical protein